MEYFRCSYTNACSVEDQEEPVLPVWLLVHSLSPSRHLIEPTALFESGSPHEGHAHLELPVHLKLASDCPASHLGLSHHSWLSDWCFILIWLNFSATFFWLIYCSPFANTLPSLCLQRVTEEHGDSSILYHPAYVLLLLVDLGIYGWWRAESPFSIPAPRWSCTSNWLQKLSFCINHFSPNLSHKSTSVQISMQLSIWSLKLSMTPKQLASPSLSDPSAQLFLKYTALHSLSLFYLNLTIQTQGFFFLFTCSLSAFLARL